MKRFVPLLVAVLMALAIAGIAWATANSTSITVNATSSSTSATTGKITIGSDQGAVDANVSIGFVPSKVEVRLYSTLNNAKDNTWIWDKAMSTIMWSSGPDSFITTGITAYDGTSSASKGFTIDDGLFVNSDVLYFTAYR